MRIKVKTESFQNLWGRYKYVGLVVLVGMALLLWPSEKGTTQAAGARTACTDSSDASAEEERMTAILSKIRGTGQLQLMLSVQSGPEQELARDTELSYSGAVGSPDDYTKRSDTVVISGDSGDEAVVTGTTGPTYRGALVVCQGADDPAVRLAVTQAVSVLTGLSSDRISVVKCQ